MQPDPCPFRGLQNSAPGLTTRTCTDTGLDCLPEPYMPARTVRRDRLPAALACLRTLENAIAQQLKLTIHGGPDSEDGAAALFIAEGHCSPSGI